VQWRVDLLALLMLLLFGLLALPDGPVKRDMSNCLWSGDRLAMRVTISLNVFFWGCLVIHLGPPGDFCYRIRFVSRTVAPAAPSCSSHWQRYCLMNVMNIIIY